MAKPDLPRALRVGKLLFGGDFDVYLDAIAKPIYLSVMNDVSLAPDPRAAETSATSSSATLFSFLDAADRLFSRISEALRAVGLSYAKYDILNQLSEAGEPVSLRTLAEGQGCAASNITQLMDRLESDGLVRRVDDPEDRRSVRAELTPEGAVQAQEGATQIEVVRAQFAAAFTAAERAELGRLLAKIR